MITGKSRCSICDELGDSSWYKSSDGSYKPKVDCKNSNCISNKLK